MQPLPTAVDVGYMRDVLLRLIAIDSRNPVLTPGAPGEKAIGEFIHAELGRLGLDVRFQATADPDRPNVVATIPGTARDTTPSLMLNGHMDTVSVEGMTTPFTPWEQAGQIYGRGSQDMKGSLAVMMGIAACLKQTGTVPPGDLVLAFVTDEEANSIGTEALVQEYVCDQTLVLEPTGLQAAIAHRGFVWYTIHSEGRAAHGSRYEDGVDAIGNLGLLLRSLQLLAAELVTRPGSPLVGPPSMHISTIQGGTEISVYPAHCEVTLERRVTPDEDMAAVTGEIQNLVDVANRDLGVARLSLETGLIRTGFQTALPSPLLERLTAAFAATLDRPLETVGAPYWTDAALLATAGSDCLLIGPLGFGLHSLEEWIDLDSMVQLSQVLLATILNPTGHTSPEP